MSRVSSRQEKIAPQARAWDAGKWIPEDIVAEAGRIGLLGVMTPRNLAAPARAHWL